MRPFRQSSLGHVSLRLVECLEVSPLQSRSSLRSRGPVIPSPRFWVVPSSSSDSWGRSERAELITLCPEVRNPRESPSFRPGRLVADLLPDVHALVRWGVFSAGRPSPTAPRSPTARDVEALPSHLPRQPSDATRTNPWLLTDSQSPLATPGITWANTTSELGIDSPAKFPAGRAEAQLCVHPSPPEPWNSTPGSGTSFPIDIAPTSGPSWAAHAEVVCAGRGFRPSYSGSH
jgi:hypothetical protein